MCRVQQHALFKAEGRRRGRGLLLLTRGLLSEKRSRGTECDQADGRCDTKAQNWILHGRFIMNQTRGSYLTLPFARVSARPSVSSSTAARSTRVAPFRPRPVLGREHLRVVAYQIGLLFGRQQHHSACCLECSEAMIFPFAEIRMPVVRAFDDTFIARAISLKSAAVMGRADQIQLISSPQ